MTNSTGSEQWSGTDGYYRDVLNDCRLKHVTDFDEYIEMLGQNRYTVLISAKNSIGSYVTDDAVEGFKKLG